MEVVGEGVDVEITGGCGAGRGGAKLGGRKCPAKLGKRAGAKPGGKTGLCAMRIFSISASCSRFDFALLFWNQILTCVSVRLRLLENSARSAMLRYCFSLNFFSNAMSCCVVNGVLGLRFGLCFLSVHLSGPSCGRGISRPIKRDRWNFKTYSVTQVRETTDLSNWLTYSTCCTMWREGGRNNNAINLLQPSTVCNFPSSSSLPIEELIWRDVIQPATTNSDSHLSLLLHMRHPPFPSLTQTLGR